MNRFLIILFCSFHFSETSFEFFSGGVDSWSEQCTEEVKKNNNCKLFKGLKIWRFKNQVSSNPNITMNMTLTELKMYCDDRFKGLQIWRHANDISKNPEISKNMTLTELKMYCDDRFVCLENTYCYKDSYNYQILDECIEDVFQKGPMSICNRKLREILKTEPNKLSECVKEHLAKTDTATTDCLEIQKTGKCLLPDVEKYCDPWFLPIIKEHLSLRLYNLACDGRLRYRVGANPQQNILKENSTNL